MPPRRASGLARSVSWCLPPLTASFDSWTSNSSRSGSTGAHRAEESASRESSAGRSRRRPSWRPSSTIARQRHVRSLHLYFIPRRRSACPDRLRRRERPRRGSFTTRRVAAASTRDHLLHDHVVPVDEDAGTTRTRCPTCRRRTSRSADRRHRWARLQGRRLLDREWSSSTCATSATTGPRTTAAAARASRPAPVFRADGNCGLADRPRRGLHLHQRLSLLGASLVPHSTFIGAPDVQAASLDHVDLVPPAHRGRSVALYDQTSPSASGARGLSTRVSSPRTARWSPPSPRRA